MYGDYYFQAEAAEKLDLSIYQLQGRLNTHKEMKCLFEIVFIPTKTKRGLIVPCKNLMLHKDKLEELRHLNDTRIQTTNPSPRRLYGCTPQSARCHAINCNCSLCEIHHIMGDDCKMREKVQQLVEDGYEETLKSLASNWR